MAKVLKTTKDQLLVLLNTTDRVPATKLASDVAKHVGFRRAIKKHLKDFVDKRAELQATVSTERNKAIAEQQKLQEQLAKAKDKAPIEAKLAKNNTDLQLKFNALNEELLAMADDLKISKVEVTFDNEEFTFESKLIKDNSSIIFAENDKFDADTAEIVLDLLDSVA